MSFGGFNLRKWHANLLELHDLTANHKKIQSQVLRVTTLRGPKKDPRPIKYWEFCGMEALMYSPLRIKEIHGKLVCKRTALRITTSIFDLLGFLSPYVIKFKILFQCLCCNNHQGWDDPLAGEMLDTWNSLISELSLLSSIQVPRRCCFRLPSVYSCMVLVMPQS